MRRHHLIVYVLCLGALLGVILAGFLRLSTPLVERALAITDATRFDESPVFVGSMTPAEAGEPLHPVALSLNEGKLLVSYLNTDRVDEFSETLELRRSFRLLGGAGASFTGIAADSSRLYATDDLSGELLIMDYHTGRLVQSIGFLPDYVDRLKLTNIAYASGILYVTDAASRQVLVISPGAVPSVRDEYELILHFPSPSSSEYSLQSPSGVTVTPDGRLLVGDSGSHGIKAFTCSGRFAHLFDESDNARVMRPTGLALDNLPSPELLALADTVFHPSGIYEQGRIHVVDAGTARVKVFDPLGKYVLTYGAELRRPHGIAIDQARRLILVADTELQAIMVYKY